MYREGQYAQEPCEHCGHLAAISLPQCPHCARPSHFPNVRFAEQPQEREALAKRYDEAMAAAESRGCREIVERFEQATTTSKAVLCRSFDETYRLARSPNELYATFYQLLGVLRLPEDPKWDVLREVADTALFGRYKKEIRFAALSLNEQGLDTYGDCFWVMSEKMISHRASVFKENSVLFMERHGVAMAEAHRLPKGYRAPWAERGRLCVAKLAGEIEADTPDDAFPSLLLHAGATTGDDDFVEAHIGGSMTAWTLEKVSVPEGIDSRARRADLRHRLQALNVKFEERPWTP